MGLVVPQDIRCILWLLQELLRRCCLEQREGALWLQWKAETTLGTEPVGQL